MNQSKELAKADASSLLRIIRQRSAFLGARLTLQNVDAVASAADISERFNIPLSTLRRWKKAGRVVAFRPKNAKRDLFPLAQFSRKSVAPWAEKIISQLGNGMPAFHFLVVRRRSLGNVSYSRRALDGHASTAKMIEEGLRWIEVE